MGRPALAPSVGKSNGGLRGGSIVSSQRTGLFSTKAVSERLRTSSTSSRPRRRVTKRKFKASRASWENWLIPAGCKPAVPSGRGGSIPPAPTRIEVEMYGHLSEMKIDVSDMTEVVTSFRKAIKEFGLMVERFDSSVAALIHEGGHHDDDKDTEAGHPAITERSQPDAPNEV